jgi:hypothetical protein
VASDVDGQVDASSAARGARLCGRRLTVRTFKKGKRPAGPAPPGVAATTLHRRALRQRGTDF